MSFFFCSYFQFQSNAKVRPKKNVDKLIPYICLFVFCEEIFLSFVNFASGQLLVGGYTNNVDRLSSVEVFPPFPNNTCSIPDLPQPRVGHSLSLLSGGRLVVCGGSPMVDKSCISWTSGSTSWTELHILRSCHYILHTNQKFTQQHQEIFTRSLDTTIPIQLDRAAERSSS